MDFFVKNKINTDFDLIAKELKRAREDKNLSIEEVSLRTKINQKYLIALENGDFLSLPEGLYGKNFLKQYSQFLGLSIENILEVYDDSSVIKKDQTKKLFSNQIVKNKYFLSIPNIIRNLIIFLIVLVFFSYLIFSFQKINNEPSLSISYPPDNFISENKTLEITGKAENGADVTINGVGVLVGEEGNFSQKINLKTGINEVVVEAKKKHGKTKIIKKQILLKE